MDYQDFINSKLTFTHECGFEIDSSQISEHAKDFQAFIIQTAIKKGRFGLYEGTGLGKTLQELEIARIVSEHTGKPSLIFAPLAVAKQTEKEADKFGIKCVYIKDSSEIENGVYVTNYERYQKIDESMLGCVIFDESSSLKDDKGKLSNALIKKFSSVNYRFCASATAAPNNLLEWGMQAEMLGICNTEEMKSQFFINDMNAKGQTWRLRGNAHEKFYEFLAEWCVIISNPGDLGFEETGKDYILPPLVWNAETINTNIVFDGELLPRPANTQPERLLAGKKAAVEKVKRAAEMVNNSEDQWVIAVNTNDESTALTAAIHDAVEVTGSMKLEDKVERMIGFSSGKYRVLVSKASIVGWGMNWQNCHNCIYFANDSFEKLYQFVRRFYRFGQEQAVNAYVFAADVESAITQNVAKKQEQHDKTQHGMVSHMKSYMVKKEPELKKKAIRQAVEENYKLTLQDCIEYLRSVPDDYFDMAFFSPPFKALYQYSDDPADMSNVKDADQFWLQFDFLVKELYRTIKPGRIVAMHCMNLNLTITSNGLIGLSDFRGDLIRAMSGEKAKLNDAVRALKTTNAPKALIDGVQQQADQADDLFVFHAEATIWKDPNVQRVRTRAKGLAKTNVHKDGTCARMGIPDYFIAMRKPGDNKKAVTHDDQSLPVDEWWRIASPVWMDIKPNDVIAFREGKTDRDDKHMTPTQREVTSRAIRLYSNPGDLVFDPFTGSGTTLVVANQLGRKFEGTELKESYFDLAVKNAEDSKANQLQLVA